MNPYMEYNAANTKIIAKRSELLNKDDWDQIFECSTVDQVMDILKKRPIIQKIIANFKSENIHRADMETVLCRYKTMEIENMLHYFSGPYKEFLQIMLMEYEIADLSLILRKIVRKDGLAGIEDRFVHSEKYTRILYDKLLTSNNVVQFTENLKGTIYYDWLKTLTNENDVNREFHIEMKLKVLLYRTLLMKSEKLRDKDMKIAKDIVGLKIDFANVQWIYRAMKYYNISPEETLIYSLSGGRNISYQRLKKLCYAKSLSECKQISEVYLKMDIFQGKNDADIESAVDYYVFNYLKKHDYRNTIGSVVSFFYMMNILVSSLIAIIEGIKYKIPKEKLKEYLGYRI